MSGKIRIGELLVENGIISAEQLEVALSEHKKRKLRLGRTLIELGYVSEPQLLDFLARQLRVPFVDLTRHSLDASTVRHLPETHARRFRAIVLEDRGDEFLVGLADPTDIFAADEIARVLGRPVRRAVVREADLLRIVDLAYRRTDEISNLAQELRRELGEDDFDVEEALGGEEAANAAPVAKLLGSIFEDAVQVGASDVHIEPDERTLRIRLRIDGVLHEQVMREKRIAAALVQRLKLMSGLDISEKRLPQDGRFPLSVRGREIDVRLSVMPVRHGESVVMRLLDPSAGIRELVELGLGEELLPRVRRLLRSPHGMLLVTGPTGSGKTTTLYAMLGTLNQPERKIITAEDPVEYSIPRVNQVQIHHKIGLDFARVLRSALRQDPDIVMVGEIRDQETAEIGLRAAMTGHLVLSTLHTNDAISSVVRLVDMGAEGYLVAASLRAVLAQRLVRRVCDRCAEVQPLQPGEQIALAGLIGSEAETLQARRGAGCTYCSGTGYRGRTGLFELLELDPGMADALRRGDSAAYVRAAHAQRGRVPLTWSAFELARAGVTTVEEVLRVAGEVATDGVLPQLAPAAHPVPATHAGPLPDDAEASA